MNPKDFWAKVINGNLMNNMKVKDIGQKTEENDKSSREWRKYSQKYHCILIANIGFQPRWTPPYKAPRT
jgi:hypothetical protein